MMLKSSMRPLDQKCRLRTPPGGAKRSSGGRKLDYLEHLREKQKVRRTYGVMERQFRACYKRADRSSVPTGVALIRLMESRLDNVVYRMGFAVTRSQSRQMVSHGMVLVDGCRINIPSYQVSPGQAVSLTGKACAMQIVKVAVDLAQSQQFFSDWVEVDYDSYRGVYKDYPPHDVVAAGINDNLIVEYYSK